jgi:hypothetical protein
VANGALNYDTCRVLPNNADCQETQDGCQLPLGQNKTNCWFSITWLKKDRVGNEILFYFEIFVDTAGLDTTSDPLAVTMLVLSTGRCLLWKISINVMVRG